MAKTTRTSIFDSLLRKADETLDKAMNDPQKVETTKSKAKQKLGQRMDPDQAAKVVDQAEALLSGWRQRRNRNP